MLPCIYFESFSIVSHNFIIIYSYKFVQIEHMNFYYPYSSFDFPSRAPFADARGRVFFQLPTKFLMRCPTARSRVSAAAFSVFSTYHF